MDIQGTSGSSLEGLARGFASTCPMTDGMETLALLLSPDGTILDLNQRMALALGKSVPDLKGTLFWPHLPSDCRKAVEAAFQRAVSDRRPRHEDLKCGGHWHDCRIAPSVGQSGEVIGVVVLAWDITEHKRAEEALRESEERFRQIAEKIESVFWIADPHISQMNYVSPAYERIWGRTCESLYQQPRSFLENVHPEDRERVVRNLRAELDHHQAAFEIEYRIQRPDGLIRWIRDRGFPVRDHEGKLAQLVGIADDVTERRRAEDSARLQSQVLTSMNEGVVLVRSSDSRIVLTNPKFDALLGYEAGELVGQHIAIVNAPTHLSPEEVAAEVGLQLRAHGGWEGEILNRKKDGALLWCHCSISRFIHNDHGEVWVAVQGDITERKRLEERLRQSQKMEGIGHLAGGIAHEFNNILAAMMASLSLVRTAQMDVESRAMLAVTDDLAKKAADIVKRLLAFSRQSVMRAEPMDWVAAVSEQSAMLSRLLGERIRLEFSTGEHLSRVNGDRTLLEQVLMNLCLNARDAMKDGGVLRLEMEEDEISPEQASRHGEYPAGRYVRLSVTDTGCGMDERTMERLFEPFFTTKQVGKGTGLGLSTVKGIVEQLNGWVEVESQVGKGSTFRVCLPALTEPVALTPPDAAPPASQGQGGTILLVEDDVRLRELARLVLTKGGYTLLEAQDPEEALGIWRHHRNAIDLVYSDIVMPGELSGRQLVERLLAEKPGLRVILTSGYHADLPDLTNVASDRIVYLPKPCPPKTLLSVIAKCLGASHPS
jgi:two-component system, cell cycle sensor histidine kinase and response regulator CckA